MKNIIKLFICSILANLCIGCNGRNDGVTSDSFSNEVTYSDIESISNSRDRFYLFVYAPWCPHCQQSIPLVREKFSGRDDAFYLNGESMSLGEHLSLRKSFINVVKDTDPLLTSESTRVLYPSLGLYMKNELVYAKSGLPKTLRNIDLLIDGLDEEYG